MMPFSPLSFSKFRFLHFEMSVGMLGRLVVWLVELKFLD